MAWGVSAWGLSSWGSGTSFEASVVRPLETLETSTEIVPIDRLPLGTVVEVRLRPSTFAVSSIREDRTKTPLPQSAYKRVVGIRAVFLGHLVENDTIKQRIKLFVDDEEEQYIINAPYSGVVKMSRIASRAKTIDASESTVRRRSARVSLRTQYYVQPTAQFVPVSLNPAGAIDLTANFTHQVSATGSSFTVSIPAGFTAGGYTVTATYNTVPGANTPEIEIPAATRGASSFVVVVDGTVDVGTTIDFHVTKI